MMCHRRSKVTFALSFSLSSDEEENNSEEEPDNKREEDEEEEMERKLTELKAEEVAELKRYSKLCWLSCFP